MSSSPATPTAAPNADGGAASAASPTGSSFTSAPGDKSFDKELFDASAIEVVYQRVTKGRHDLKKLKTYFEARAEMSRVYVKAFNKASAQPDLEDSSSIGNVWKEIRETGNSQVKQQEAFIAGCMDIAVVLESQIVEVKKSKTTLHATWTKLVADVKKKQQMHDKSKDVYYESVKQAETAVMNRDAAHEQKMPDKAVQKAETRAKQCLKEVETLHSQYQKSVTTLQEAQATHDVTVVDLLQQFEKLERTRLRVFLDQLERFAGQHDGLNANLESVAASLHQQTKAVNISADIQEFIRANASGKAPTPHVEYIPCQSKIIDHAMDLKPSNAGTQPVNAGFVANTSPLANNHAPNHNAAAAGGSSSTTYAEVPITPAAASAAGTGETAVALYDFDQNEPDDLAFKAGEIIKLLASPETEDWWQGEKDGRIGIFPKAYVQKGGAAGTVGAPGSAPGSSQQTVQVAAPVASTATSFSVPPPTAAAAPVVQSSVASTPAAAAPKSSNPFGDDSDAFGGGAATSASPAAQPGEAAAAAEVPKLMSATCAALFDFEGQDDDELTFKVGDSLVITGELNGWYLGKIAGTEKIGIFPSNYVNLQA